MYSIVYDVLLLNPTPRTVTRHQMEMGLLYIKFTMSPHEYDKRDIPKLAKPFTNAFRIPASLNVNIA